MRGKQGGTASLNLRHLFQQIKPRIAGLVYSSGGGKGKGRVKGSDGGGRGEEDTVEEWVMWRGEPTVKRG